MFKVTSKGDYKNFINSLKGIEHGDHYKNLERFGKIGVDALSAATPKDSGLASSSWGYRVFQNDKVSGIDWYNDNIEEGASVILLRQYGHGTGTGGYVAGLDFINPAIKPIFDQIEADVMLEVMKK